MGCTPIPLLVISPTYRERENLEAFTTHLWRAVPTAELLLVDDASGDGTPSWARRHPAWGTRLHLIERPAKDGLGTAYREGFSWALDRGYTWVVQMDADLTHDAADIPRLVAAARLGADLVLASRPLVAAELASATGRRALSRAGALAARLLLGLPFSDPTGGFKLWRREALLSLGLGALRAKGFAFQLETTYHAWRLGLTITEVPIRVGERQVGASNLDGTIVREACWILLRLALERRSRFASARSTGTA
jgi:dolichol-phosphate mannosyltransferase